MIFIISSIFVRNSRALAQGESSNSVFVCPMLKFMLQTFELNRPRRARREEEQQLKILGHVVYTNPGLEFWKGRDPKKNRVGSCWNRLKTGVRSIHRRLSMKPTSDDV